MKPYSHFFDVAVVIRQNMPSYRYREGVERAAALNAVANQYLGTGAVISAMQTAFRGHEIVATPDALWAWAA